YRHAGGDVGSAVGDELLRAVDHPVPIADFTARLGRAGVAAGLRLGEAERPQLPSREQLGQPALLLLLGAELVDRRRAQADRCFEGDADARVRPGNLFDGQAKGEKISAGSTVLFGKGKAEETNLPHLPLDVIAEPVLAVELLRSRSHHLPSEGAARVANRLLFGCQIEVHGPN